MFGKTVEHEMKGLARLKIDNYILLLNYRVKCISYKRNEMISTQYFKLDGNS